MKDDAVAVCPECDGAVKRLLYPVGIVFKGTGWYVNDSRKPDKSDSAEPASDASKDGGAKPAETTTDTKSETTTESKSDSPAPAKTPATAAG